MEKPVKCQKEKLKAKSLKKYVEMCHLKDDKDGEKKRKKVNKFQGKKMKTSWECNQMYNNIVRESISVCVCVS